MLNHWWPIRIGLLNNGVSMIATSSAADQTGWATASEVGISDILSGIVWADGLVGVHNVVIELSLVISPMGGVVGEKKRNI